MLIIRIRTRQNALIALDPIRRDICNFNIKYCPMDDRYFSRKTFIETIKTQMCQTSIKLEGVYQIT